MSVQADPVPPVPEHTPPLREDESSRDIGKFFGQPWTRWFVSIQKKINVINESLVNLLNVSTSGFLVKDGSAWTTRTFQDSPGIVWLNADGTTGNPTATLELMLLPEVSL